MAAMDVGYDAPASSTMQPDCKPTIDGQMATTHLRSTTVYQTSSYLQPGKSLFSHSNNNNLPYFSFVHGLPNTSQYPSAPINQTPLVQTVYRASMNPVYAESIGSFDLFNNLALDFHTLAYRDEGIITSYEDGPEPALPDDEHLPASNPMHLLGLQPSAAAIPSAITSEDLLTSSSQPESFEAASFPSSQQAGQYIQQATPSTIASSDTLSSSFSSDLSTQFSSFHSDYDLNYSVPTGNFQVPNIKNPKKPYSVHKGQGNSFVDFAPNISYHIPQHDECLVNYASPNAEFMRVASLAIAHPPYTSHSYQPIEAHVMRQPTHRPPFPLDPQYLPQEPSPQTAWSFAGQTYHVANFGGNPQAPELPDTHAQPHTIHPRSMPTCPVLEQPAPKYRPAPPHWTSAISPPFSGPLSFETPMKSEQTTIIESTYPQRSRRKLLTREEQDYVLIEERKKGVPYEEIKQKYGMDVSTEALRGRHRNLTLPPDKRLRHPKWTSYDVKLLEDAVPAILSKHPGHKYRTAKRAEHPYVPWAKVAELLQMNGSSCAFSPMACSKKYKELRVTH